MKDVLLRGKRTDNGEWVYGDIVDDIIVCDWETEYSCGTLEVYAKESYEVQPETVGMYTGLDDKNGKKIFSDDVVLFGNEKHIIEWSEFDCGFVTRYGDSYRFDKRDVVNWEVIGNIHDNKEFIG